ncbi:MAG: ABC transporter permease [Candidatus Aminicenantes bacterium]
MTPDSSFSHPPRPPRLAEWIFRRLFPDKEIFTTLGDLEEIFKSISEGCGERRARLWYWGQLFKSLPHRIIGFFTLDLPMFILSLKIMIRSLRKNKVFSFLNIFTLTLGLVCFLLIFLYMRYEVTYDAFHSDHQRIYRVRLQDFSGSGQVQLSRPIAPLIETEIPEVEQTLQFCHAFGPVVKVKQQKFRSWGTFADEKFLEVFRFPFHRKIDCPLSEPFAVVLTESAAERFLGTEDPMGKTLSFIIRGEPCELTVTGVLADLPRNTHFNFDLLISFQTINALPRFKELMENVSFSLIRTYVKLNENASVGNCEQKLSELVKTHSPGLNSAADFGCALQPITDIHLRPDNRDNRAIRSLYLYLSLGVIILIIAGINYVNLSTARSSIRMREIGIRKTIGAQRSQLIKQFIGEAVILTTVSFFLALTLIQFVLPIFNRLLEKDLSLALYFQGPLWLETLGIVLLVGIAAGLYPALFLSSFQPARVLKGAVHAAGTTGFRPSRLRNVLVVIQFTISVVLINIMLFIFQQVHYIRTMDTGFEIRNVIEAWVPENSLAVKNRLLQNPKILGVTMASNVISLTNRDSSIEDSGEIISYTDESGSSAVFAAHHIRCGHAFLDVFHIPLIAGRNFSEKLNESRSAIVNETFIRRLGLQNPLLERINIEEENKDLFIIGVVKDFHFQPITQTIKPLILSHTDSNFMALYARVRGEDMSGVMAFIRKTVDEFDPNRVLTIHPLDERLFDVYRAEQGQSVLLLVFSTLAVLIACLGLFGLAVFTAERKTKEIGIRKVLGAETKRLLLMLSKEFALLSLFAVAIGLPLSIYLVIRWMENFAYHVPILPWTFLLTGVLVLASMLLTAGTQIVRIVRINPVEILKYE